MIQNQEPGVRRGGSRPGAGRPLKADTTSAILDAASDILLKLGYGNLTVDAVAARAGVAKTTIYRRWPSKAALVAVAVEELSLHLVEAPDSGDLRGDLQGLLQSGFDLMLTGPGRVLQSLVRESGQHPELADLVNTITHARRRALHRALNSAIARGEVHRSIDSELAVDLLMGVLWTRMFVSQSPVTPDTVDHILDLLMPGLTG